MFLAKALVLGCALAAIANGAAVKEIRVPSSYPFATWPLGLDKDRDDGIGFQIVGGNDAYLGQFPHQVSMQVTIPGYQPQHLCGGTLIARQWVLTAAHCAYGVPSSASRVDVVLGITNLAARESGVQRIQVTNMLVHGQYDPNSNGGVGPYDIAMLKLASAATLSSTVKLALLPVANAIHSGSSTLSGWGSTSKSRNRPVYPNQLQTASLPIVDYSTCYKFVGQRSSDNPLADTNLCTGPIDSAGLSSCSGDSGGPLIQQSGSNAVVIGVVSWGLGDCGSVPFPSVYTRVSAYINWIQQVLSQY